MHPARPPPLHQTAEPQWCVTLIDDPERALPVARALVDAIVEKIDSRTNGPMPCTPESRKRSIQQDIREPHMHLGLELRCVLVRASNYPAEVYTKLLVVANNLVRALEAQVRSLPGAVACPAHVRAVHTAPTSAAATASSHGTGCTPATHEMAALEARTPWLEDAMHYVACSPMPADAQLKVSTSVKRYALSISRDDVQEYMTEPCVQALVRALGIREPESVHGKTGYICPMTASEASDPSLQGYWKFALKNSCVGFVRDPRLAMVFHQFCRERLCKRGKEKAFLLDLTGLPEPANVAHTVACVLNKRTVQSFVHDFLARHPFGGLHCVDEAYAAIVYNVLIESFRSLACAHVHHEAVRLSRRHYGRAARTTAALDAGNRYNWRMQCVQRVLGAASPPSPARHSSSES